MWPFNRKPLDIDFLAEPEPGPRFEIHLQTSRAACISREDIRSLYRYGIGVRHWWLRHQSFGFSSLSLPRGDRPVDTRVMLPTGRYVLGVGRGLISRRISFEVTSEGSLGKITPDSMGAHVEKTPGLIPEI